MADLAKQKIIVVCGPTASGKTGLGVTLAGELCGEILSADSMQIYRGLTVGTAKVTPQEMAGVPHHLLDIRDPQELFSVADFVALAQQTIADIAARGQLPFVVGGTGLYLSSLLQGVRFVEHSPAPGLREQLEAQAGRLGAQAMWEQLNAVDPAYAATVHANNQKRVLRALEIYRQTGCTMSDQVAQSKPAQSPYQALVLGLRFAERETLYRRIDARVDAMMAQGLLQEAELVYKNKNLYTTAAQAIGYKEFFDYFESGKPLVECVEELKRASRRYAKRQLTWFGRMPEVQWIEVDRVPSVEQAARQLIKEQGFGYGE